MPEITDYEVVAETSLAQLEGEVARKISFGWQPLGGVCFDSMQSRSYMQAMVKYAYSY